MALASVTKKATISADIFGSTLTITFRDGREFAVDVNTLSPSIQQQAMLHGMKQKLVDAAAIARSLDTGATASINDKYDAVREVFERITGVNPTWNKERATLSTTGNGILVRALMKMTGKDKDYVDAFLAAKSKEERASLRKNPRVMAIIAEFQAATVSGGVDTDALLAELGGDVASREPGEDDDLGDGDENDESAGHGEAFVEEADEEEEPVAVAPTLAPRKRTRATA